MAKSQNGMTQTKPPAEGVEETIRVLARKYADRLKKVIDERLEEMKRDDQSHFLIYQVLGIGDDEGRLVDEYQNKGRFLYSTRDRSLRKQPSYVFWNSFQTPGPSESRTRKDVAPRLSRLIVS